MGSNDTAMQKDGIFYDGEAEACASHAAAAALVDTVEAFEDAQEMLWGDAHTIIAEAERPTVVSLFCADVDGGALASIIDSIIDKVTENAVNERGITLDDDVLR